MEYQNFEEKLDISFTRTRVNTLLIRRYKRIYFENRRANYIINTNKKCNIYMWERRGRNHKKVRQKIIIT